MESEQTTMTSPPASPSSDSPSRTNLIFFSSADPVTNPSPIISACHFAATARKAGLVAELRLAGDAVRVLDPAWFPTGEAGERLREALDKVRSSQPRVTI